MKCSVVRARRALGLVMLIALFTSLVGAPAGAARAQAAEPPFLPVTLARLGPMQSGGNWIGTLPLIGDWTGYSTGLMGCGHCVPDVEAITLRNVVNGTTFVVRPAVLPQAGGFDSTAGAQYIQFAPPYLLWRQPVEPAPTPTGPHFRAGDFNCAVCMFNVLTGEGGPAAPLQALDPTGQTIQPLALDPAGSGRAIVRVQLADRVVLHLTDLAHGTDRTLPALPAGTQNVSAVINGPVIAWEADQPGGSAALLLYHEADDTVRTLASSTETLGSLQSNGVALFWVEGTAVKQYTLNGAAPQTVAGALPNFRVGGDRIAWIAPGAQPSTDTLIVQQISTGATSLRHNVSGPAPGGGREQTALAALTDERALLITEQYGATGGPPADVRLDLVWTLTPDPAYARTWARADAAVAAGQAARSWLWGPAPRFIGQEAFSEGPGGRHQVLYYDKSRMEVNDGRIDPSTPNYVTNGLLTVELISGEIQTGRTARVRARAAATIPVAGDARAYNPLTPDYAALAGVASIHGEHQAASRIGQAVDDAIDAHGTVSKDSAHAGLTRYAAYAGQTGHNIPALFDTYLRGMQGTYGFDWTTVLGYPITEAYWTQMRVNGQDHAVLVQAYQRRVLTYTPDFPQTWQIQQGNVGQHYLEWRYTMNAVP
jgi:hypothetical protein